MLSLQAGGTLADSLLLLTAAIAPWVYSEISAIRRDPREAIEPRPWPRFSRFLSRVGTAASYAPGYLVTLEGGIDDDY